MFRPKALAGTEPYGPTSSPGREIWNTLTAAAQGDASTLSNLLSRDPKLCFAEYVYTQPIYLAVREGHLEATRILLDHGADPAGLAPSGETLMTVALDRNHREVAELLQREIEAQNRPSPGREHPIHSAVSSGNVEQVVSILGAEPDLLGQRDPSGATLLHRAVIAGAHHLVDHLLDLGANPNALHGPGPGSASGYPPVNFQPADCALWRGPHWNPRGDFETVCKLADRGATYDIVLASAIGDSDAVLKLLKEDPSRLDSPRPCGKRALSTAVQFDRLELVKALLERGANPNLPEGDTAPMGTALYWAASRGDAETTRLLLEHGANPNAWIDASGSATYAAADPQVRDLLLEHGGTLDPYDWVWLGEHDRALEQITKDPSSADRGCGGVLAAACTLGQRDLLERLLAAGVRVPPVLSECRSYLWEDPELLSLLLANGMEPDLPDWQRATPLHSLCSRDHRGRPRAQRLRCAEILLDAGADLHARDEDFRSTPLAWAARNDLPDMVDLLLSRGSATRLDDDPPWATPLAWAVRRGHQQIIDRLKST